MSDEQRIAGLREQIRGEGRVVRANASALGCSGLLVAMFGAFIVFGGPNPSGPLAAFAYLVLAPTALLAGCVLLTSRVRARHRCECSRNLIRVLSEVPSEARDEVLLPLLSDGCADTREIAASVARAFGYPTELSPAATHDGRGAEAAGLDDDASPQ